jgi:hypothetical protein
LLGDASQLPVVNWPRRIRAMRRNCDRLILHLRVRMPILASLADEPNFCAKLVDCAIQVGHENLADFFTEAKVIDLHHRFDGRDST